MGPRHCARPNGMRCREHVAPGAVRSETARLGPSSSQPDPAYPLPPLVFPSGQRTVS